MAEEKKSQPIKTKSKFNLGDLLFLPKQFFLSTQNTIGIDIGEGYIKIVQLQRSGKGHLLTDYRVRAIPLKIKDKPREKRTFMKEFIDEFVFESRIKTSLGRLAIKSNKVLVFTLLMPPLPDKDLKSAVGVELKKRLPFQLDFNNIQYNYFITDRAEGENPQIFVTCIAVDKDFLEEQVNLLKSFKMRPLVINTNADALGNLVSSIGEYEYTAVLDMGAKMSYLNFYKKNKLQFSRDIPVGGEQLTMGMQKALHSLKKDITFAEAESFKRQCGLPLGDDAEADFYSDYGIIKGREIIAALRPSLERLINEISRTLTFYFRTYKLEALDILYITGGASRIKNIDKFLAASLEKLSLKKIEKLDPLKAVQGWLETGMFRKELVAEEASPHLGVAFGLCLGKGGCVNLLPPKEKIEQRAQFLLFISRLIFPVVLVLVLSGYVVSYLNIFRYRIVKTHIQTQLKEIKPKVEKVNKYLKAKEELDKKRTTLETAIGKQPNWWGIFKSLSNITPDEVTLQSLEVKGGTYPKKIEIKGEVMSEYANLDLAISQYTLNLDESPFFTNVKLVSSERDEYSPIPTATFTIAAELIY